MLLTTLMRIYLTRSLKPFIFTNDNCKELDFKNLDELGLYVHIPFCVNICSFCPYCKEVYEKNRAKSYKTALLKEIDIVCRNLEKKKKVSSLYFGGGTPALMADDLSDIINKLREYFVITGGIGVELHPDDISKENLDILKAAGVTMVSLGVQSFHNVCLEKLGRHNENILEKLKMVSESHFDVVDVDLIFAIPGQTDRILKEDIKIAFDNGADQISTYPFIDFTFADNAYKPLGKKDKKIMLNSISEYCKEIGVERTSVWTFAKPNSLKYSSVTRESFLGFGVSATTLLKDSFKINTFSINEYINKAESNELPTALTCNFTKRQRAVYYLFWSAYSIKISSGRFEKVIGKSLESMYGTELWLAEKAGLVKRVEKDYYLSDKASYLYHSIEQVYTTEYIDRMWNVLRKEAFPHKIVLK